METVKCIMKPGDWIFKQTIREFTPEQWETFRVYLKSFGYRISNAYGKVTVDYDTVAVKELVGIMLDSQDLKWTADAPANGKIIDKHTILRAINAVTNIVGDRDEIQQSILKVTEMTEQKTFRDIELERIKDKITKTKAEIVDLEKQYEELKKRRTGRTTAIALRTIAEAMSDPNTPIKFVDHVDNKVANLGLCECIKNLIEKLGLKHLHIDCNKQVLYYELNKC